MQKFHGFNFMTVTDFATGYWQIPLHVDSRKYTAFLYNSKVYQFCRLPFGLKTSGSIFIRVLRSIFGTEFDDILTMYVDDFLIATRGSFRDHLTALCRVFNILQQKNFTLKLSKCIFCKKTMKFLGHELSIDGIRPLKDKLKGIINFSRPENQKQLQQFLGMCTYYRQFTVKHAELIAPF